MTSPTVSPSLLIPDNVRAWGSADGLLGSSPAEPQSLQDYVETGGYQRTLTDDHGPHVLAALENATGVSTLRGRGGAAFPTMTKLRAVASAAAGGSVTRVVANGAEGEPLSYKDRYLMRFRPHAVLDGLLLAAAAVDADVAFVYVADPLARASMTAAVEELDAHREGGPQLRIFAAQDTYVAGEESAVVRSIQTGVARPTDKPPRPYQIGVDGVPTLVINVETVARLARSVRAGATPVQHDLLVTVSGMGIAPRLLEVPDGLPLGDLVREMTGERSSRPNVIMGGFFGGIVPAWPSLRLNFDAVHSRGSSLGCGALHLLAPDECPVKAAADIASFYSASNAKQCRTCMSSTDTIASVLASLGTSAREKGYERHLARWSTQLRGRGACAVPDGVALLLRTLLRYYPREVSRHIAVGCPQCAHAVDGRRWERFTVTMPGTPAPDRSVAMSLHSLEGAR
ncbi:putative NADH dehydrogenase (quinone) [Modestobacter italicus]|uniref:NADH dehydrogenase (Quinone) n=1 Tax=Modestobacter italicus (strain DSM 44449 / CECT 9708 / BC 501) TaxID=2732864 RepID=I4F0E6_MODI5|nr:NADH-ubiquinone oxidoreductase-F iron-sulfur binding region domain-containing protein [Modestobacter marinus]CCH89109.1 putative NADH dehydrogenase (quinone) [Modestobacter marinus]